MLKSSFFFLLSFWMVGCQTHPYVISESPLSAADHRRSFVAAFGEARAISQNGREIYSYFHNKSFKLIEEPDTVKTRYYTKVMVLGNRRPYDVAVEVRKEQKDPETKVFLDQGIEDALSERRLAEFETVLNQSREKQVQSFDVENPF